MPVDKFGRSSTNSTTTVTRVIHSSGGGEGASLAYIHDNFLRVDGSTALTGRLDMGNNAIGNVANPVSDQDAATKHYVELRLHHVIGPMLQERPPPPIPRKPVISVTATERGRLDDASKEWSFGSSEDTTQCGYPVPRSGRIICMGLSAPPNPANIRVAIVKNNLTAPNHVGVLPPRHQAYTVDFDPPLEVNRDDFITLITLDGSIFRSAVACFLIELDI